MASPGTDRFDRLLKAMLAGPAPSAERNHHPVKHQVRNLTHVPAILKLPQILRKVLPADMNVRAVDPALQLRPEAFNGVHASAVARGVLARAVVDFDVPVAASGQCPCSRQTRPC